MLDIATAPGHSVMEWPRPDVARRGVAGVYLLDCRWRFLYASPGTQTLLGRPVRELVGRVIWKEFPELRCSVFHDAFRKAVREQVTVTFEALHLPDAGWVRVHVHPCQRVVACFVFPLRRAVPELEGAAAGTPAG